MSEGWRAGGFGLRMEGMKPVTLLCVVSVVLNVAGGIYVATRLSATQAGGGAGGARTMDGREVKTGLSEETKRLLAVLRDRLRAEGLRESIVRDVVSGRLWTERQAKLDAADPIKKRPWWQQTREQLPGDGCISIIPDGVMTDWLGAEAALM